MLFSSNNLRESILRLFNECLRVEIYPWKTSIITPLHKKGSIYNPDNYRAIAIASNLGKLFASILLKRLIEFRHKNCPDTPNQLGFCKNAQTSDHILTLHTCIEKYTEYISKGRLYTCFIDYAKAFDSVCREALFYKLWSMGITGRFFGCLNYMYTNSKAKIKLLDKLSSKIEILCGTEQGHPLSPELFKCYIQDLSDTFNNTDGLNAPRLNDIEVNHLLWADDLILMALDKESLQRMLNILLEYCLEWGLTINYSKTAIMIFSKSGRQLKESFEFFYCDHNIQSVRQYCYLGIVFSLSGSFIAAQQKLRQKGMQCCFSLKKLLISEQ